MYDSSLSVWDNIVTLVGKLSGNKADNTENRLSVEEMFGKEPYDNWTKGTAGKKR